MLVRGTEMGPMHFAHPLGCFLHRCRRSSPGPCHRRPALRSALLSSVTFVFRPDPLACPVRGRLFLERSQGCDAEADVAFVIQHSQESSSLQKILKRLTALPGNNEILINDNSGEEPGKYMVCPLSLSL